MAIRAYYNEFDPGAAAWLRELIKAGHLPAGDVDERSITEVQADDLRGYSSCHFFAGIGGWGLALRLAGWPDERPVWTGSCPCQPYSAAGKRLGDADERNLWPHFFRLIRECRPEVVFGEQVASAEVVGSELEAAFIVAVQAGRFDRANKLAKRLAQSRSFHFHRRWLDGIQADLEGAGYAFGNSVLGAHSVQAPHVRQRLFWVASLCGELAHTHDIGRRPGRSVGAGERGANEPPGLRTAFELEHAPRDGREQGRPEPGGRGTAGGRGPGGLGHTAMPGCGPAERGDHAAEVGLVPELPSDVAGVAQGDASGAGLEVGGRERGDDGAERPPAERAGGEPRGVDHAASERAIDIRPQEPSGDGADDGIPRPAGAGFWSAFDLIPCRDGKARRVEPGTFPLAHGTSAKLVALWAASVRQANEEVSRYAAASKTDPAEVLRALQAGYAEEALREPTGGCRGVPPPPFLLDFLCDLSPASDGAALGRGLAEAGAEASQGVVRGVRRRGGLQHPPRRQQPDEQQPDEPANSLRELSRILARCAEACWAEAVRTNAATVPLSQWPVGRVGLLRGYGNAIVPQVAAEFIKAFLEVTED